MPIPHKSDLENLLDHFASPLVGPDRIAYRRAAEAALARIACSGPGIVHRELARLQREYFHPPSGNAANSGRRR